MRDATIDDIRWVADRLRQSDRDELEALSAAPHFDLLENSFVLSKYCHAWVMNGKPVAIWGVIEDTDRVGVIWMMGTGDLDEKQVGLRMGRESKYWIETMKTHFSGFINFIDARQHKAIKWLRWLGFNIEDPIPYGVHFKPFHPFWMKWEGA